ncbi:MAG: cytochrome c biogenesis protein CcdA [bacterium]
MDQLLGMLENSLQSFSLISYVAAFGAGVLTSFTPCVYPMLPVTVAYIGGKSGGSRMKSIFLTLSYVLGIAVMYSILGAAASLTGSLFGRLSTNPWIQFGIANIFILIGLSMLDVWQFPAFSCADKFKTSIGSKFPYLGAFLFGIAAGSVFAPCTAPVLGAILVYVGTQQNVLYGISVLFVFAVGMSTLLFIAGISAGFLTSLPKAGKWTERIKKAFGVIFIIMGEYFLINAGKFM